MSMISKFNVLRDYTVYYSTWGTGDKVKEYNLKALDKVNALIMFHNKRVSLKSQIIDVAQCPVTN